MATAIGAAFGGWGTWLLYRYSVSRDEPLIEAVFGWDHPSRRIAATLNLRNRRHETIIIESARLLRPRGGSLSWQPGSGPLSGPVRRGTALPIGIPVAPLGTPLEPIFAERYLFASRTRDAERLDFYVSSPDDWRGGKVSIELSLFNSAAKRPNAKKVASRFIRALNITQTDANASISG